MKEYLVYLAGPIANQTYTECTGWRQHVMDNTEDAITCLSPLRSKGYLKDQGILDGTFNNWHLSTQRGIYARDKFDCHRADLVFVNLLGSKKVSMGTCMEIAWAAQNNTPIILIMEKGNIHDHPMIKEACPFIVDTLDEGVSLVHALLLPAHHE